MRFGRGPFPGMLVRHPNKDMDTNRAAGAARPEPAPGTLKLLVETGLTLARERRLDAAVRLVLDVGKQISRASGGCFFYSTHSADGVPRPLFLSSDGSSGGLMQFAQAVDGHAREAMFGGGVVRCADILPDVRFGPGTPFASLTQLGYPVRSYMAVPVHSARGALLGGLLLVHGEAHMFGPELEPMLETLAAQAAMAIENTQLYENLSRASVMAGSARRLTQEKAATERRLRQALDAAELGTWTWARDTDMMDLDQRAAELFHVEPHVPVGRGVLREKMVAPEDRKMTEINLKQAVESRGVYRAEYRVMALGGETKWIAASGIPVFAEDSDDVVGMVGTVQDMTPRHRQEDKLRETEKLAATGRLAATIAHEINNPLEAVTNLIYLVKTDVTVPGEARQLLETADQELARVAQIAQQTLGFYRDTTRPGDVDIGEILRSVTTLFQRKLLYKKIECVLDLEPDLRIFGLQGELRQVFSNLIVNAIDASLQGRIVIRARRHKRDGDEGVSVLICDRGAGIPAALQAQLFSPFFTTKQRIGTGLGLWVSRGIVEKQGGSIRFRSSTEPPAGTVFRVYLPSTSHNFDADMPPSKFLQ